MTRMEEEERAIRKREHLKTSARKRGLDFDLTVGEVKALLRRKTCYFLGTPLLTEAVADGQPQPPEMATIDRIDASKGYVRGNVVACSGRINMAKNDLTLKELKRLVRKLNKIGGTRCA